MTGNADRCGETDPGNNSGGTDAGELMRRNNSGGTDAGELMRRNNSGGIDAEKLIQDTTAEEPIQREGRTAW